MPRTKTVSDTDVLDAANMVLAQHGMQTFTLAAIAQKVGLSRATLIQRFKDKDTILRLMAERELVATREYMASLPVDTGPSALWNFLKEIVLSMGNGQDFSVRVTIAALEIRDPVLKALADRRYRLVQDAIATRLDDRPDGATLAAHLHAVIAGATMQWIVKDHPDLSAFVLKRVALAMKTLFPDDEFN